MTSDHKEEDFLCKIGKEEVFERATCPMEAATRAVEFLSLKNGSFVMSILVEVVSKNNRYLIYGPMILANMGKHNWAKKLENHFNKKT